MFRRALVLGIILPLVVFIGKLIIVGISKIEFGEFKPVVAIFLLDVSASNRNLLYQQQQTVLKACLKVEYF